MPAIIRTIIRTAVRATIVSSTLSSSVALAQALPDHDNGPFAGIFGLPDSTEGADLLRARASAWSASFFISSHSMGEKRYDEALLLDGETTRFELRYRYGLSSRLEIGMELPYVWHESGTLDSLVDGFHEMFGLPGGIRPYRPSDTLEFYYEDGTGVPIAFDRSSNGIGDLRLTAGWQLSAGDTHRTALRFGLKLPTGDSRQLHGSGGTDLSLGFAGGLSGLLGSDRITAFYRLNAIYLGQPRWLADRHSSTVGQVAAGIGYMLSNRAEVRLQGTVRSAMYESNIETLGDISATLMFGGNVRLREDLQLSFAMGEDLDVRTAPDVSFQVSLRYQPER